MSAVTACIGPLACTLETEGTAGGGDHGPGGSGATAGACTGPGCPAGGTGGAGGTAASGAAGGTTAAGGASGSPAGGTAGGAGAPTGGTGPGGADAGTTGGAGGAPTGGAGGTGGTGGTGGVPSKCGDGTATDAEECDDGNLDDADGCTNACTVRCSDVRGDARKHPTSFQCYWVHEGLFDDRRWESAVSECQGDGGHLVTVTTASENDFVATLHDARIWLGARDGQGRQSSSAGTYAWHNGQPWGFSGWGSGEPSVSGNSCWDPFPTTCYEHCASMSPGGAWNDLDCELELDLICEWSPPGRPQE